MITKLMNSSIRRLSHVFRYSSIPTIKKESVAEHTAYVALYSMVIGKDLIRRGFKVDLGVLLERALVHDIDESLTGDFLRTVKYGHPGLKNVLDEVSIGMISSIEKDIGVDILESWKNAKGNDIEGNILKLVDLLQVAAYVIEELKLGNIHVSKILSECSSYIEQLSYDDADPMSLYAKDAVDYLIRERERYDCDRI